MRKIFFVSIIFLFTALHSKAQGSPEALAEKIARKMKDSLSLTDVQKAQLYTINLQLHNQKINVWQQQDLSDLQINSQLQAIENRRDSLYRAVLSPEKFILYKSKKRNLINNN